MHLFHFPGAGMLTTVSLLVMANVYFAKYSVLSRRYRNWRLIPYGLALGACSAGTLFRYMHWPHGELLAAFGTLTSILVLGLVFLHRDTFTELEGGFRKLGLRLAIAGLICGTLWAIPEQSLIDIQYRDDPEYGRLLINYRKDRSPENEAALRAYEAEKYGSENNSGE